jgi:hypothetical protein
MASSNVVASITQFATKAKASGDKTVQTPAAWATAAGFPGSKASALRKHFARDSGNGCGRNARYGKVDAAGLLQLIAEGHAYHKAETDAKKAAAAKRIAARLKAAAGRTSTKVKASA